VIKLTSNYRGISLLPTAYKMFSNFLVSTLTPYIDEVIGDNQCGFQCNRADILHLSDTGGKKKKKYSGTVHQLEILERCLTQERSTVQYSH